jgi:hypothetical protein
LVDGIEEYDLAWVCSIHSEEEECIQECNGETEGKKQLGRSGHK